MPRDLDIHIVPQGERWAVVEEGTDRPLSVHDTQEEATQMGQRRAAQNHSEMLVHGRDGQIRARNSYGNDPYPPRG